MKYSDTLFNMNAKYDYKGKIIFEKIFQEIEDVINYISPLFENIGVAYFCTLNNKKENYDLFINRNVDVIKLNQYNKAYLVVFFNIK